MHTLSSTVWQNSGPRQWKASLILRLIFLAIVIIFSACDSFQGEYQENERNKMEAIKYSSARQVSQPLVDLHVPAKVETATFGLG
jgi:hypothetical protein